MTRAIARASPTAIRQHVSNTDRTGRVPTSDSSTGARRARLHEQAVPAVPVERVALVASAVPVAPAVLEARAGLVALAVSVVPVAPAVPVERVALAVPAGPGMSSGQRAEPAVVVEVVSPV
jgi:hypothetical protein